MIANRIVKNKLSALHKDAKKDFLRMGSGVIKSIYRPLQPEDMKLAYLPISRSQGEFLHELILESDCKQIVEFGTSFGISSIYLADASRKTNGKLVTTELLESKAKVAIRNIEEAGLSDFVDVRIGDAMNTLKGYTEPIDLLFLDGWKDLYLPLFKMLENNFHQGTIIYADNMNMSGTKPYADYVIANSNKYSNQIVDGGKAFLTTAL